MSSWFSGWSPIKSFPEYSGPYDVGTVDVEIPAADLPSPAEAPEDAQATVAFRMFYPCVKPESSAADRPVRWIPQPQKATITSFAKFLGMRDSFARGIAYLPQQLYYINIPAHRNAKLLDPPTSNGRWPVMFFSHGLAGSRNAYSQICGDMASHGLIVIAMDHRDGSSPIQYVRATATTEAHIIESVKIAHAPATDEVYQGRDKQLRIRLWEICMAYEAITKIDAGHNIENLDSNTSRLRKERMEVLWQFNDMLDIHRPGRVSWSGHSFGAATTVQLLKSIYYYRGLPDGGHPLIRPNADAAIIQQIAPESPALLLDMWGLPLQSPFQTFLWDKPLPSYAVGGPNGANVLSVLSEAFQNWSDNLNVNKTIVAAPSPSRRPSTTAAPRFTREKGKLLPTFARLRAPSPASDSGYASENSRASPRSLTRQISQGSMRTTPSQTSSSQRSAGLERHATSTSSGRTAGPHMFYAAMSQHFSQSDFGVLFPWIAKKLSKAEEPERVLQLNTRAMVQVIRESGIEVGGQQDAEILQVDAGLRRWIPIAVQDGEVKEASRPGALSAINRKLSVTSTKSVASGRDGMTMGQKMEAQMGNRAVEAQLEGLS